MNRHLERAKLEVKSKFDRKILQIANEANEELDLDQIIQELDDHQTTEDKNNTIMKSSH
jgi:hypothetical protein